MSITREVNSSLDVTVSAATELEFQITVAKVAGVTVDEELTFSVDGTPVQAEEIVADCGSRIHRFAVDSGTVSARYSATVSGDEDFEPSAVDRSVYLRPSRYAECDKFFGFSASEFDLSAPDRELATRVAQYVRDRLSYVPGASDPIDGAVDTLLAGAGVCRDYAHLVVALARSVKIPARLVAVYAPGCDPMDFHAVAELLVDGRWSIVDATGLAPRQSLVRIATGRDAADTAFLDNHGGAITLDSYSVNAIVVGELPTDDGTGLLAIGESR